MSEKELKQFKVYFEIQVDADGDCDNESIKVDAKDAEDAEREAAKQIDKIYGRYYRMEIGTVARMTR